MVQGEVHAVIEEGAVNLQLLLIHNKLQRKVIKFE